LGDNRDLHPPYLTATERTVTVLHFFDVLKDTRIYREAGIKGLEIREAQDFRRDFMKLKD
jgi:hypothetical protein